MLSQSASDKLMMQTIGTFSSAHVAPPASIQRYLNSDSAQAALPSSAFVPQSTQYNALQLYNQLETIGAPRANLLQTHYSVLPNACFPPLSTCMIHHLLTYAASLLFGLLLQAPGSSISPSTMTPLAKRTNSMLDSRLPTRALMSVNQIQNGHTLVHLSLDSLAPLPQFATAAKFLDNLSKATRYLRWVLARSQTAVRYSINGIWYV